MDRPLVPMMHPALLLPGTVLGSWRLERWAGRGMYGAVYQAVPVEAESAAPVALKVAFLPGDPRFAREVELLSRMSHLHVPRLVGQGEWQAPDGVCFPFFVMEWVDGVPLYEWARRHPVSSQQVRRWVSQLAWALAALHEQGGVHRDVKGGNVLVRRADGGAVLTDFGTGVYEGATTLTPLNFYPGTPAYQTPECLLLERQFNEGFTVTARYQAGPSDDLYALGVTACRLLTGEYPEMGEFSQDRCGTWRLGAMRIPSALLSGPRVEPELRAVILRLLSVHREQRGTAVELAEELERQDEFVEVRTAGPREDSEPLKVRAAGHLLSGTAVRRWLPVAAAGLLFSLEAQWMVGERSSKENLVAQGAASETGPTRLAEAAVSAPLGHAPSAPTQDGVSNDALPEPLPGQTRPDEKGRCPRKGQVALNKGCWAANAVDREGCEELDGQMYKGTCYVPFIPRGRHPNNSSLDKR